MSEEKKEPGKNKKLIFALIALVVIVGAVYLLAEGDVTVDPENGEDVVEDSGLEMVREPHLFLAGTGGEIGQRDENEAVSEFNPGDYLGVSGEYMVEEEGRMWGNILDRNEGMEIEEALSPFTVNVTEDSSGFSMCCAAVPGRENSYYIEIIFDGERVDLIPFEVAEGDVEVIEESEEEEDMEDEEVEEVEEEGDDAEDEEE